MRVYKFDISHLWKSLKICLKRRWGDFMTAQQKLRPAGKVFLPQIFLYTEEWTMELSWGSFWKEIGQWYQDVCRQHKSGFWGLGCYQWWCSQNLVNQHHLSTWKAGAPKIPWPSPPTSSVTATPNSYLACWVPLLHTCLSLSPTQHLRLWALAS